MSRWFFYITYMASYLGARRWRFTLLAVVGAGAIGWARWKGWIPDAEVRPHLSPPATTGSKSAKPVIWSEWRDCTLVENRANDGDSFLVRHDGVEHTVRLYFADSPEKYRNQYNQKRLAEQGRYFGGLTEDETIQIGEAARDFSLERLRLAPFRILTRNEKVFDSGRIYAFVAVAEGDLAELLVGHGLARIYTKGENRPGGPASLSEKQHLLGMERRAREARTGGWRTR